MAWTLVQKTTRLLTSVSQGLLTLNGVTAGNLLTVQESYFQGSNTNSGVAPSTPTEAL